MKKYNVVGGLLNDSSKKTKVSNLKIVYIKRSLIIKNEKNDYSIEGIRQLADDIYIAGIEQPLVVSQTSSGEYRLYSGERRITAADLLIEEHKWDKDVELPCIVKELNDYELPLNDELKEKYAIIRTNIHNRNKTDADILKEIETYKEIIIELKKEGYEKLPVGESGDGEIIYESIKGKTRNILADKFNISTGQVSKYEKIIADGDKKIIEAIDQGRLSMALAYNLLKFDQETRKQFWEFVIEVDEIIAEDITDFIRKIRPVEISRDDLQDKFNSIIAQVKSKKTISEDEYKKIQKSLDNINKMLKEE